MTVTVAASFELPAKPIYLLHGYDSGQIIDLLQRIKSKFNQAKRYYFANFTEFMQFNRGGYVQFTNQDLFSKSQINTIIEVHINNGRLTKRQLVGLEPILASLADHNKWRSTVVILVAYKLSKNSLQADWVKKISKIGLVLATKSLSLSSMRSWSAKQFNQANFTVTPDALDWFVELHQQDLIAAKQSIDKLSLIFNSQLEQNYIKIDQECLGQWLNIDSKFNLFDLQNALASSDRDKTIKVLYSLKDQHQEELLVLWAIIQQINKIQYKPGGNSKATANQLPELLNYALEIDLLIKNIDVGGKTNNYGVVWSKLFDLCWKISA